MPAIIVTLEDLQDFKQDLLAEIRKMLSEKQPSVGPKKWLKTYELRKLLSVFQGTLQHLRTKGALPLTKIGGTYYYDLEDVEKMLMANKTNRDFSSRKNNPWRKI